jgi:hypothetical protein
VKSLDWSDIKGSAGCNLAMLEIIEKEEVLVRWNGHRIATETNLYIYGQRNTAAFSSMHWHIWRADW